MVSPNPSDLFQMTFFVIVRAGQLSPTFFFLAVLCPMKLISYSSNFLYICSPPLIGIVSGR